MKNTKEITCTWVKSLMLIVLVAATLAWLQIWRVRVRWYDIEYRDKSEIAILPSCWLWYPIMMTKYLGEPLPEAGRRLGSSWRCLRGWLQRNRPPNEKPDFGWGQRQALATPVTTHIPGLEINNNIKNNNNNSSSKNNNNKSSSNNNSSSKNNNNNSNNNSSKNIRTISRLTHIPGLDMRGRFRLDPVYNGK